MDIRANIYVIANDRALAEQAKSIIVTHVMNGEGSIAVKQRRSKEQKFKWYYDNKSTNCQCLPLPFASGSGISSGNTAFASMFGSLMQLTSNPAPSWAKALDECKHILGSNGIVAVTFWNLDAPDYIYACFYTAPSGNKYTSSMLPRGFSKEFEFSDPEYNKEFENVVFDVCQY